MFLPCIVRIPDKRKSKYTEVKIFKQEIINYNKAINRIKYSLDNPEEFIYDDCSELKRSVQLETEEIIADIKQSNQIDPDLDENKLELEIFNLIQNEIDQSQAIINAIDDHEKMSKSYWIGKGIDKKLFNKDYNKLKQFSDLFIQNWTNRLDELKFEDKTMTEAADKLREYQAELNNLTNKVKMYLFNNNCIELRHSDEKENQNRLSCFLYYKQNQVFNHTNRFDLKNILKQSSIQTVKDHENDFNGITSLFILENGNYLVIFRSFVIRSTYLAIYDPVLKKLVKEKFTEIILSNQLNINHNLIALKLIQQNEPMLVIMNHELEVIKQIPIDTGSIKGSDKSFIYICDRPTNQDFDNNRLSLNIKVLDWSLETVKNINFQNRNRNEPFFHDLQDTLDLFITRFKSIKNNYVLKSLNNLFIYNENGALIRKIDTELTFEFLDSIHDQKECIILINENLNKLNYYDLNGKLIKETNLINIKFSKRKTDFQVKFNSNNDVIIFDAYSNILHL